ncbi:BclA C-terminal domain-containing protein [Falsibacillus pallidus]|uniref:BclA C-terminal domain-containing protein n=1 Tax=Falsibacillus pallidus TaxID=493781 RepID=A0A370GQ20_9BACI|nr:hypothetical protein [Falsibacillus pallidus]RDI45777.1 hypothetical protein DFR59_102411 [Falsibacillus pallidus]
MADYKYPGVTCYPNGSNFSTGPSRQRSSGYVVRTIPGPQGPAGPAGSGLSSALSAYNDAGAVELALAAGAAVPFNTPGASFGEAITQTDDTTFSLNETGFYSVDYSVGTAAVSALGGIHLEVGGATVSPSTTLLNAGARLSKEVLLRVDAAPANLQLVVDGLGLTVASGTSSDVTIKKVADLSQAPQ